MKNKKVHITTLGCDKNTIDSQMMMGLIKERAYTIVDEPEIAEIIIVNTCCFIQEAKEQSIEYILDYAHYKEVGQCKVLIAAGCMAERYYKELSLEIPEIDGFLGVGHFENVIDLLDRLKNETEIMPEEYMGNIHNAYPEQAKRLIPDGEYSTFVRISEGCDHLCTYCVIPKIRGRYRSRKSADIFKELRYLEASGIKEIIIIGQDIAPYGKDLKEGIFLPQLLDKIASQYQFEWIRLMYLYPEGITPELIKVVNTYPQICRYFDIPFQHTDDHILKRMGRKMTGEKIKSICKSLRENIPDVIIRTSIITGFPGETQEHHQQLLNDLKEIKFDRLGVFKYSQEENTPASEFPHQIDDATKEKRYSEIMMTQQEIAFESNQNQIGRTLKVLIEEFDEDTYIGRSYGDAPGIDGAVYVNPNDQPLVSGEFYPVKIVNALEYDLIGDIEDEFTK